MHESSKTNEVGESELTESESHLNRLKDGEMSLHTLLNPSLQPTKSSSTAVNMAVGILGKHHSHASTHYLPLQKSVNYQYVKATLSAVRNLWQFFVLILQIILIFAFLLFTAIIVCIISALTTYYGQAILAMEPWVLGVLGASFFIFFMCIVLVCRQPQTSKKVSFMVCKLLQV